VPYLSALESCVYDEARYTNPRLPLPLPNSSSRQQSINQSINLYSPMQLQANNKKKCGRLPEQAITQQSWPP